MNGQPIFDGGNPGVKQCLWPRVQTCTRNMKRALPFVAVAAIAAVITYLIVANRQAEERADLLAKQVANPQRFTQAPFKLIRWLRAHWHQPTSLRQALLHLTRLYAQL